LKMKLTRKNFRAIIFDNFRRGLSRQECIDKLKPLNGEDVPSYSTVKNCINEFNRDQRLKTKVVKVIQKQSLCQRT